MDKKTTGDGADSVMVELTAKEAGAFVLFRKYQETIEMLSRNGAFDMVNGHITMHFKDNKLMKIEQTNVFSRPDL
jgi:hypothetical protein